MCFFVSAIFLLALSRLCDGALTVAELEIQTQRLLSPPSFAVVGTSDNGKKFGTIAFKTMLEKGMPVVPINPLVASSQGIPCLQSLADIADPTRTSIPAVTQPSVTLEILRQAQALNIFSVWLQPGAEDAAVLEFIANATFAGGATSYIHAVQPDGGPCFIKNPIAPDVISTLQPLANAIHKSDCLAYSGVAAAEPLGAE
ncbi:hypothetical protein B0H17DRAFT_1124993 [Mycena rosella]|uniref:CoA-binding domain-containing protein n=1 Tax=Mycena rosella TaxID=1033263 RepID=A0AAD7GYP8_MYCRO|nr:hypothetical protein B0H17DRAFT_1124993 [Mycena rosella]